jgi:hypothetical protein
MNSEDGQEARAAISVTSLDADNSPLQLKTYAFNLCETMRRPHIEILAAHASDLQGRNPRGCHI